MFDFIGRPHHKMSQDGKANHPNMAEQRSLDVFGWWKKCSHAIPTTRSPIVPVLGVLCGGVCVCLRLYDNSAGCLLAMKEEHMENDPWNGLLPLMFCSDHFWKVWDICGHIVNDSNQPFITSRNLSPHLWAAPQWLWKRLKVWSMQWEAHASLPNLRGTWAISMVPEM